MLCHNSHHSLVNSQHNTRCTKCQSHKWINSVQQGYLSLLLYKLVAHFPSSFKCTLGRRTGVRWRRNGYQKYLMAWNPWAVQAQTLIDHPKTTLKVPTIRGHTVRPALNLLSTVPNSAVKIIARYVGLLCSTHARTILTKSIGGTTKPRKEEAETDRDARATQSTGQNN